MNNGDIDRKLPLVISREMKSSPAASHVWKWRVINEYPENLKEAARAYAMGEAIPNVEYNGVTLEFITENAHLDFFNSLELLYIISSDPESGFEIFDSCVLSVR